MAKGAIIENCWNNKSITGVQRTGGICGQTGGTVRNCNNYGTVTGSYHTGGIVGLVAYSESIIEKCYNNATINGIRYVGGIVGSNSGTIKQCQNGGDVQSSRQYIGGIVGENNSTVTSCYNIGSLTGTGGTCGGIAGNSTSNTKNPIIQNCYNIGEIASTSASAGLIVGSNSEESTVTNCYSLTSTKELIGSDSSENTANCAKKTQIEMQAQDNSFISLLNTGLETPVWIEKQNDYPILSWQVQN